MSSVGLGSQELLKDIEEAIEKATQYSRKWYHNIPIPPVLQQVYEQLLAIVMYKPPMGIVALYTTTRLITSGRLFRLESRRQDPQASVEAALVKQQGRASDEGRMALMLDADDASYQAYGGIDRVRQQVCAAALLSLSPAKSPWAYDLQSVLKNAMQVQSRSGRLVFLQDMSPFIARLESLMDQWSSSRNHSDEEQVWLVAAYVTQVRTIDALLRVTRDRLLQTSHRLGRTVSYWQRRVQQSQHISLNWLRHLPWHREKQLEQDRLRLAYATAAYRHERTQLGKVVQLLLERPVDLPSEHLLQAFKESKQARESRQVEESSEEEEAIAAPTENQPKSKSRFNKTLFGPRGGGGVSGVGSVSDLRSKFSEMKSKFSTSKYYLRWRPEGGKLLSIRQAETYEDLDPDVAAQILLSHEKSMSEPFVWKASTWTQTARETICSTVKGSLEGTPSRPKYDLSTDDFERTSKAWCRGSATNEEDWKRLLLYVDHLAQWRRTGEGQTVRLRDAALISWTRRLDFFGIPSTLLKIKLAEWIHSAVIPHWPEFRVKATKIFWKVLEILQQRVWVPVKGIYDEIMNKSKGMMSGFGLGLEENTLDHLLRDMGFGDGTAATRAEALRMAAEQYEHDLKSGLFVNFARGRLVRLLLIQVQQLKVGLLSALDTIDVLMKGNQIHFQFLAAIPAVLIATFGTRFFLRFLYTIRSKDLRPVTVAHSNMSSHLSQIERLILLDDRVAAITEPDTNKDQANDSSSTMPTTVLSPATLGEISLYMYRYLTLLDFSSSLFPSSATEQIHVSLQGLLETTMRQDGSADLTLRWLDRIQAQHRELLKHV